MIGFTIPYASLASDFVSRSRLWLFFIEAD